MYYHAGGYFLGNFKNHKKGVRRAKTMSEKKEVEGRFRYEQDSKRYHRFQIETEAGIVGTVYIQKSANGMPKKIVLEYAGKK